MTSVLKPGQLLFNNIGNLVQKRRRLIPTTREKLIKVITDLTSKRPPLFPTYGQNIPTLWIKCKIFLNKIRDMGYEDEDALFKAVDKQVNCLDAPKVAENATEKRHQLTKIKCIALFALCCGPFVYFWFEVMVNNCDIAHQSHFEYFPSFDSGWMVYELIIYWPQKEVNSNSTIDDCIHLFCLAICLFGVLGIGLVGCKWVDHILSMKFCNEEKNETPCPYMVMSEIMELRDRYVKYVGTCLRDTHLREMLTVLEAEGAMYTFGDLVFLHPPFVAEIMKTFSNHIWDLEDLKSTSFRKKMIDFVGSGFNDYETLNNRLETVARFGKIDGKIDGQNVLLQFLWRHLKELNQNHYSRVINIFREQGIIINSTFDVQESEKELREKHPIVVFRLPAHKHNVSRYWPPIYPSCQPHFELRIQLPAGCPKSLAISFAAKCHAFGDCLHAWIYGATVVTTKNDKIHAELKRNDNGCDYIVPLLYDEYSKFLCSLAITFMKEQERYLPGLLYDILWTCPECIRRINAGREGQGITTFLWDPDEKKEANSKIFRFGKMKIYLQLLDGSTLLPIMTYKVIRVGKKMQKVMKFGAFMCTVGIKASVVWNVSGTITSMLGVRIQNIDKEQLEKIKSFLAKVNAEGPSAGLMSMSNGSTTYSGDDITEFSSYLEDLERGKNVQHFRENFNKEEVADKKCKDALRKAIVNDQSGKKQVTWIDKRKNVSGLGYEFHS